MRLLPHAVTASIIQWLQDNELADVQSRERAYAAVCDLWKQASAQAREASFLKRQLPARAEDISAEEESTRAYSEFVGSLVRSHSMTAIYSAALCAGKCCNFGCVCLYADVALVL